MVETYNGFTTRADLIKNNGVCHANFIPIIDTLCLQKCIQLGNTLTLEFIRSPNNFALLAPNNSSSYKVTLSNIFRSETIFTT